MQYREPIFYASSIATTLPTLSNIGDAILRSSRIYIFIKYNVVQLSRIVNDISGDLRACDMICHKPKSYVCANRPMNNFEIEQRKRTLDL